MSRAGRQFRYYWHRFDISRKLAIGLVILALLAGIATWAILTGSPPLGPDPRNVILVLYGDLAILLLLGAVVARRVVRLWVQHRSGVAGSRLHVRMVFMFSLVAVTPAILLAMFSVVLLNVGVESWFKDKVKTALDESTAAARAYLEEHQQNIRADVLVMAVELARDGWLLRKDQEAFSQMLGRQARLRNLTEAMIFEDSGNVLARTGFAYILSLQPEVPLWAMKSARDGDIAVMTNEDDDRVRALVKLDRFEDTYLYVGRLVDPRVIDHIESTLGAVSQYEALEQERSGLQLAFGAVYAVVSLLLLLAAVWFGLSFATRLIRPVSELIDATREVAAGNLQARVPVHRDSDELGNLSRTFNMMTRQLDMQQKELIDANRQIDQRRRFIEAVLAGVSVGVIGLDQDGHIELCNRFALDFFNLCEDELAGSPIETLFPDLAESLDLVRRRPDKTPETQIKLERAGRKCTLLVKLTAEEEDGGQIDGFVVTFNDITELMSAQRKAAWADVARRIAHEIKNPLTPIQLSAERLKRKYLKEIHSDPETFKTCTDTIVRQVGDIGRMVDEFSAFARMPAPSMRQENLADLVRQAVFLQRNAHTDVTFGTTLPDGPVSLRCDSRQIGQALTNLLQNAIDAIEGRPNNDDSPLPGGEILVSLFEDESSLTVMIQDNGRGLPVEGRENLTEPYVTTRAKGTGLGLAIVRKIMEDHSGEIVLQDRPEGGAQILLRFSKAAGQAADGTETSGPESSRNI